MNQELEQLHTALGDVLRDCHAVWMDTPAIKAAQAVYDRGAIRVYSAATQCDGVAVMIDICAGLATEHDHRTGQYGNWRHDAEVLRMAARILRRSLP